MKQILILGNSIAGVKAAEELRAADAESAITILGTESFLPVNPDLWPDALAKMIPESKAVYRSKDFYEKNRITLVIDKTVDRLNLRKNYVATEDKEKFSYDVLIITDTPGVRYPDIKGTNRSGVFAFRRWSDARELLKFLPFIETVALESSRKEALAIAAALNKAGKEVFLITPSGRLLEGAGSLEDGNLITQRLEHNGIRIFAQNGIEEVLGEAEAMAIRLKSGKVIAAQAVVFLDTLPDFRKLLESPLEINDRIRVDASLKTTVENVYAVGDLCEVRPKVGSGRLPVTLKDLEEQGRVIAANILGQTQSCALSDPPAFTLSEIERFLTVPTGAAAESTSVEPAQNPESKNLLAQ